MTITRRRGYLILIGLWAVLVLPVLFSGRCGTSEAYDERNYHVPEIERLVAIWPQVEFADQGTATSPGYHYAVATIVRLTGTAPNGVPVRLLNALVGLALLVIVFRFTAALTEPNVALLLTLPFALSSYFLGGSIWLTTDNAALLPVVVCIGLIVTPAAAESLSPRRCIGCAAASLAAVAIRQIHLWTIAPVAAAIMVDQRRSIGKRVGLACLVALPSIVLLVFLAKQWDGLTPPKLAEQHGAGFNGATPAFALALCAGFGLPLLTATRARLRFDRPVVIALIVGLLLGVLFATSYRDPGRYGGWLWQIVRVVDPVPFNRSILIAVLAPLGAAVVVTLARTALERGHRDAVAVLAITAAGFLAAHIVNPECFQRYFEPPVIIALAWLTALCVGKDAAPRWRWWWTGPAAVAAGMALISAVSLYREVLTA